MSYVPDIVTPFCVSAIKKQAEMTQQIVTSMWRNRIFEEAVEIDYDQFKLPFDSLRGNAKTLIAMESEINEAFQFFNQYPSLDLEKVRGQTFLLHDTGELINISPRYIMEQFPKRIETEIGEVLRGQKKISELQEKYDSPVMCNEMARRFYSTTLPDYMSLKHLANLQTSTEYPIDAGLIRNRILPFLVETTDVRFHAKKTKMAGGLKRASFLDIIETTRDAFDALIDELDAIQTATEKAVFVSDIEGVSKYKVAMLFAAIRVCVYNTETRILALLLRMIRAYTANIREVLELKSRLSWKDGLSSKAFTEDYADEDRGNIKNLSMTNSASLIETIDELITCIINTTDIDTSKMRDYMETYTKENPYLAKELNRSRMVDDTMCMEAYQGIVGLKTDVERLFDQITQQEASTTLGHEELVFSDVLESCNLAEAAVSNFAKIIRYRYNPVPHYPNPMPGLLATDLTICRNTILEISNTIRGFAGFLSDMAASLSNNPNGMYRVDTFTARNWVLDMIDALGKFNEDLAMDYRQHIVGVADLISVPTRYDTASVFIDKGFLTEPNGEPETLCAYEEAAAEDALQRTNQYYMKLYQRKLRGDGLFLEANEDNEQENNTNKSDSSSNNDGNKSNSTKPVVHDNAQNAQGNTNNGQNGDADDKKSFGGKITAKIKNIITKIIDTVKKIFSNGGKEKNLKWLQANKQFLLNRNYVNTSVDILPYQKDANYITMVEKCIDKASTINDGTLKSTDENGLRATIFGEIKMPKTDDGLEADLVRGFKVGTAELKTAPVADNALKALVPGMIEYCENYYNNTERALDKLQEKVDDLKALDNKDGSGEDQKVKDNAAMIGTMLTTAVKAARTASKDRCNDYLLILDALAAPNKKNKDKNANAQQEGNQDNNNSNNEQK